MIHPFDAIRNPIHSRHPVYRVYKKLYQHKNRYSLGEDIVIICFYHHVNKIREYNDISYYVRRCSEQSLSYNDIFYEFDLLTVTHRFNCYFKMEGYKGHLKKDPFVKFINHVPHISMYHSSFPQAYFNWELLQGKSYKSFVDFRYAFEISKFSSNRFRKVMAGAKIMKVNFNR